MLSRRTLLSSAIATAGLTGQARAATPALEEAVVVRDTGGVFGEALRASFYEPFSKATGVKVVSVATSYGEMIAKTVAMSRAGNVQWDVISPQYYELKRLSEYLVDLGDCSTIPNIARLGVPGTCGRWGAQYLLGGVLLAFDPTAYPGAKPSSWADFWDLARFPGRRSLPNYGNPWNNVLPFALLADGVAPDKLFPLDLDRAFRRLDEIKPHISVWWKTGTQSQNLIKSKDVAMLPMWSGTAFATKRAGVAVDWTLNQMIADRGSWAVLKNCPHPNAASAFLDFYMTRPENHVKFAREIGYLTTNAESRTMLPAQERAELVPDSPLVEIDGDWVEANRDQALDRWNSWIAS